MQAPVTYPLKQAKSMADWLVSKLAPHCEKIMIGGSIRREKQYVKDVELILVPKTEMRLVKEDGNIQLDMFSTPKEPIMQEMRIPGFVHTIYEMATLIEGSAVESRYIKMVKDNIPIDIFIVQAHDFGRQVAIRTGSVFYVKDVIAFTWSRKGLCGTSDGLRRRKECTKAKSKITGKRYGDWFLKEEYKDKATPCPVFPTEESFFEFLGIKWKHPSLRK